MIILVQFIVYNQNINAQYPTIIDSIILKHLQPNRVAIIDNNLGERKEFVANNTGKLIESNHFSLYHDLFLDSLSDVLPSYFVDSVSYGQATVIRYSKFNLIKTNNSFNLMNVYSEIEKLSSFQLVKLGDTLSWDDRKSDKYVFHYELYYKNNVYSKFKTEIIFTNTNKKFNFLEEYDIFYVGNDIIFYELDRNDSYVLKLNDGEPTHLLKFNGMFRNRHENSNDFIKNYNQQKADEVFEITYCDVKNCPPNKTTKEKTIKNFMRANFME